MAKALYDLVAPLVSEFPRQFCAGSCYERNRAACDALRAAGVEARMSLRLPAESFGYEPKDVWVYANGAHSVCGPTGQAGGLRVERSSGHYVVLARAEGRWWIVDLAAGQFGIETHPHITPAPAVLHQVGAAVAP